jgi:hypothetical protein
MRAAVAIHHGDAHLRHDLRQSAVEGPQHAGFAFHRIGGACRFKRQPGTHRSRAVAQQHGGVVQVAAISRLHSQSYVRAQTGANQSLMHGPGSERHGDGDGDGIGLAIRQQKHLRAFPDQGDGAVEDAVQRRFQRLSWREETG